ncbi:unnamed protein product, partial [Mesorhabditis belari]|uniref:Palmitoyl-protein thioesterase 1 n=1 Tax=Mesorhabditis belari TaxID=2138241 RepID=A0AAF3FGD0_9BILA
MRFSIFLLIFTSCILGVSGKSKLSKSLRIQATNVPVVVWHGMGDSCCNPLSMGAVKKLIEETVPGIYVKNLMLGDNVVADMEHGFFANMNDLVDEACQQIQKDPQLQGGYHAVGFSQGGLFVRALAQRCSNPPVKNLISIGGPHQGIFGLPYCIGDTVICDSIRHLLDWGAYIGLVQNHVVQAQYWHDPLNESAYQKKNIFLSDVNNEVTLNATYKANLLRLKNFLLVLFSDDEMVVPKESTWFGYYKPGTVSEVLPMNQTDLFLQDKIGIKKLYESNRLHFLTVKGRHLQISREVLVNEVINKYLK